MLNDLHAAASRLRRIEAGETVRTVYSEGWIHGFHSDNEALAAAYLREHDENVITEEALREMGFTEGQYQWSKVVGNDWCAGDMTSIIVENGAVSFGGSGSGHSPLHSIRTLGQLRRLVSVLGGGE